VVFAICSHNYSFMYQKSMVPQGNIRKSEAPGGENSLTEGLSQGLNRAGACTGGAAGDDKKNTLHHAIDWGGAGYSGRGPLVSGPRRPSNEHCRQ